jgi:hypothetical protein
VPTRSRLTRLTLLPLAAALLLLAPVNARAVAGSDKLLRLVPENMAVCLLIENLREHASAFLASPFLKQFMISPFGKELLASAEVAKLRDVDKFVQKKLQISVAQLRDDILGDAIVLAYTPGPLDKPDREQGLLLLEARDPDRLARVLERLLALQKESGEIKTVEELTHGHHKFLKVVDKHATTLYLRSGAILAVTGQEAVLTEVMARIDNPSAASSFKGRFPSLDPKGRILSIWLNPRPYRALLEKQAGLVKGAQLAAFNTFLRYWNALDCVGLFVTHKDDCELTIAIEGRPGELPPGAANLWSKRGASAADLAGRWPAGAFLRLTTCIDLPGTILGVSEFMDASTRQQVQASLEQKASAMLGQDVVREALPSIGPECGLSISAPPGLDAGWFPHVLGAVRVRATPADPTPELLLVNTLNSLATLAVFAQNQVKPGSMSLRSRILDGTEIKYVACASEFPPGLEPAFAWRGGYLVVGSSPAAIARFSARSPERTSANVAFLQMLFPPLVAYLRERQDVLAAYQATHEGVGKAVAKTGLERLAAFLELFERLEITSRPLPNGMALSARLQFAAPLR